MAKINYVINGERFVLIKVRLSEQVQANKRAEMIKKYSCILQSEKVEWSPSGEAATYAKILVPDALAQKFTLECLAI